MSEDLTVWDAVRDAGRAALRSKAEEWCGDNYADREEAVPAFIAGGEWMIEMFAMAMQLRSPVVDS
jgi:hypothetical protein